MPQHRPRWGRHRARIWRQRLSLAGGGDDHLIGGAGSDAFRGYTGQDVLTGGKGNDLFSFNSTDTSLSAHPDVITDCEHGDKISFSGIEGDTTEPGDQPLHFGRTPEHAGDVTVTYDATAGRTSINVFADNDANPDLTVWLTGDHSDRPQQTFICRSAR